MLSKVSWTLALGALLIMGCSDDTSTPPANDSSPDSVVVADMAQTDGMTPEPDGMTPEPDTTATDTTTTDTTTPQPCDTCHGNPPNTGMHGLHVNNEGFGCNTCHNTSVNSSGEIISDGTHRNGGNDVSGSFTFSGGTCSGVGCHGPMGW